MALALFLTKLTQLWAWVQWYVRPLFKWFMHLTTNLCELQRICYGKKPGAARCIALEKSLELSRSHHIGRVIDKLDELSSELNFVDNVRYIEFATRTVMHVKNIDGEIHSPFSYSFVTCIERIWGYRQLVHHVEILRTTIYDPTIPHHDAMLLGLWNTLMPLKRLTSFQITKQWQDIGFQGDDPKTDFRGMGLLGLENLLFFAQEYTSSAKHVLAHSHHPTLGYDFAIVGINLTKMAYMLLKDGTAKTHFYNLSNGSNIATFHKFYCYLFYEFDKFWIESKPKNVMEFSSIRDKFETNIRTTLTNTGTVFCIVTIDTI